MGSEDGTNSSTVTPVVSAFLKTCHTNVFPTLPTTTVQSVWKTFTPVETLLIFPPVLTYYTSPATLPCSSRVCTPVPCVDCQCRTWALSGPIWTGRSYVGTVARHLPHSFI